MSSNNIEVACESDEMPAEREGSARELEPMRPPVTRLAAGMVAGAVLGFVLGLACWMLLSLVQLLIELVWSPVHEGLASPLAMVVPCAAAGAAIAWWNGRFHSEPQPMGAVVAASREQRGYVLPRPVASLGSFLMPLAFGAPLGPEAGLSGFIAAGATKIADALHGIVLGGPAATHRFTRAHAYLLAFAGTAGGLMGAKVWNAISGRAGIPRLAVVEFSMESLAWLVPLTIAGLVLSWILRRTDSMAAALSARLGESPVLKACACGALVALVAAALPLVSYAGTEQLPELLAAPDAHTALELLATSLVKVALLSLCLNFGWEGGPFFPLIFSAACLGIAISQVAGIDAMLAVTVVAAALVARFTRKLGLSLVVLMMIVPVRGLLWTVVPLAAGALLPTVEELAVRARAR